MTTSALRTAIKKFPHRPGIYIFKNIKNKPLYIGKALDLKNRVKSYLKIDNIRLEKMMMTAEKVGHIETGSDIEALILESQYIKKSKPAFNIMLRDDKQYGFVGFTNEKYPKIFITHQPTKSQKSKVKSQNDNSKFKNFQINFIGPFTDIGALKTTLRYLRRIFPYCTCKQLHHNYCLNYHIGKCLGFCCLKDSPERSRRIAENKSVYRKNIKAIKDILSGKKNTLVKNLEKEMIKLGREEKFEEAIELRNKLEKLKRVFENAKIISRTENLGMRGVPHRIEGYDVANIQGKYAVGAMVVFINGKPDKNEYRKFKIYTKDTADDTAMLKEILSRRLNHPEWPMPNLILIDGGKTQLNAAHSVVKNIPLVALTKDKKHRGIKIYTSRKKSSTPLFKLPTTFKNLVLQVDAEAHRFAIDYYRKLHRKKALRSSSRL